MKFTKLISCEHCGKRTAKIERKIWQRDIDGEIAPVFDAYYFCKKCQKKTVETFFVHYTVRTSFISDIPDFHEAYANDCRRKRIVC